MINTLRRLCWLPVAASVMLGACARGTSSGEHTLGRVEVTDWEHPDRPILAVWEIETGWAPSDLIASIRLSDPIPRVALGLRFFSAADVERVVSLSGGYSARWELAPGALTGVVSTIDTPPRFHGDHVHIYGAAPGETNIQFLLWHGSHADGATTPVRIRVLP